MTLSHSWQGDGCDEQDNSVPGQLEWRLRPDYSLQVRVKNGRILSRMKALGITSVAELARRSGVNQLRLYDFICLRVPPLKNDGTWRKGVESMAAVLQCLPDQLFTERQLHLKLEQNSAEVFVGESELQRLSAPTVDVEARQEAGNLLRVLDEFPRELRVVRAVMEGATYREVAEEIGVSVERARQLEKRGLRRIKGAVFRSDREMANRIAFGGEN